VNVCEAIRFIPSDNLAVPFEVERLSSGCSSNLDHICASHEGDYIAREPATVIEGIIILIDELALLVLIGSPPLVDIVSVRIGE